MSIISGDFMVGPAALWLASSNFAIGCLLVAALLFWLATRNFKIQGKGGIPGPKPVPFIGNVYQALTMDYPMTWNNYLKDMYGPLSVWFCFHKPHYVISDAELAKTFLLKEFASFPHKGQPGFGKCRSMLIFSELPQWPVLRQTVTPTFTSSKLRQYMPLAEQAALTSCETIGKYIAQGKKFEIEKDLTILYSIDSLMAILFGVKVNSLEQGADDQLIKSTRALLHLTETPNFQMKAFISTTFQSVFDFFDKLGYAPGGIGGGGSEDLAYFDKFIGDMIEKRQSGQLTNNNNLLSVMLKAHEMNMDETEGKFAMSSRDDTHSMGKYIQDVKKRALTREEIVNNILLMIIGGHHTSAFTLACALYSLTTNQDKQQILYEEIMKDWREHENEPVSYDRLATLPYLDSVINETLRLYSPVSSIMRRSVRSCTVNGQRFEKNAWVSINVDGIHKDPKYWPEPELFKPERWLPENAASIVPYSWLPFGEGPRKCAGMRLGYIKTKLFLYHVIRQYRFEPNENTVVPLKYVKNARQLTIAEPGIYATPVRRDY